MMIEKKGIIQRVTKRKKMQMAQDKILNDRKANEEIKVLNNTNVKLHGYPWPIDEKLRRRGREMIYGEGKIKGDRKTAHLQLSQCIHKGCQINEQQKIKKGARFSCFIDKNYSFIV